MSELEPPNLICPHCGFTGLAQRPDSRQPPLPPKMGCPRCNKLVDVQRLPRERIYADLTRTLREADLSVDQLQRLGEALRNADEDASIAAIGDQVPKARPVLRVAQRLSPEGWVALVGVIVTLLLGIMTLQSVADQARVSKDQTAQAQRTSQLTEQDLRKVDKEIALYLNRGSTEHDHPQDQIHRQGN